MHHYVNTGAQGRVGAWGVARLPRRVRARTRARRSTQQPQAARTLQDRAPTPTAPAPLDPTTADCVHQPVPMHPMHPRLAFKSRPPTPRGQAARAVRAPARHGYVVVPPARHVAGHRGAQAPVPPRQRDLRGAAETNHKSCGSLSIRIISFRRAAGVGAGRAWQAAGAAAPASCVCRPPRMRAVAL